MNWQERYELAEAEIERLHRVVAEEQRFAEKLAVEVDRLRDLIREAKMGPLLKESEKLRSGHHD